MAYKITEAKQKHNERRQIAAIHISIVAAIIFFFVSLIVGIISDSITLLLDASAGLVTIIVALLIRKILKTITKPPDDFYHFGYGKYEPLTVTLQGAMIIISCLIAGKFAIQDIVHPEDLTRYDLPAISSITLFVLSMIISLYLGKVAKKTSSPMLKMASLHWFIDSWMSLGMFIGFGFGIISKNLGLTSITPYIDPIMALVLIVFFIKLPVEAIMHSGLELLDMAPSKEIMAKVREVADKYKPETSNIHRMRTRKAGMKIFVDICYLVNGKMLLEEAERTRNKVEQELKENFQHCDVIVFFKAA